MKTDNHKSLTMKDIAEKLGISVRTVGRVVQGKGKVKKETKEKIEKILEETGFKPNAIARSLRTRCSYNIGFVVQDMASLKFPQLSSILYGMEEEAVENGYNIQISFSDLKYDRSLSKCHFMKLVDERRVDALIINREDVNVSDLLTLTPIIPFVLVNNGLQIRKRAFSSVTADTSGILDAACYVRDKRNPKHPFFISGDLTRDGNMTENDVLKFKAYSDILPQISSLYGSCTDTEKLEYSIKTAIGKNCDLLAFADDRMAIQALSILMDKSGKRIPEDISLLGFYDIPFSAYSRPPLSSIAVDMEEMGRSATKLAIEKISNRFAAAQVKVKSKFILRESC